MPEFTTLTVVFFMQREDAPEDTPEQADLIHFGHLAHLKALTELRMLAACGPFRSDLDPRIRGIAVFSDTTAEQALHLLSEDPSVRHGWYMLEVGSWTFPKGQVSFPWLGSGIPDGCWPTDQ